LIGKRNMERYNRAFDSQETNPSFFSGLVEETRHICFDRVLALVFLVFTAPLFLAAAISIKLSSPGPILFRQKRLTRGECEFEIYKFRTMFVDFDKYARGIQVKGSSTAITPVGRFLRRTKIDELPQLLNILKGDMCFVGPRPELPRRLGQYSAPARIVFTVRSGITSPASILLAHEESIMDEVQDPERFYIQKLMPIKIDLNLYYISRRSFFLDLRVMLATFFKVIGYNKAQQLFADSRMAIFEERLTELKED